MAMSLSWMRGVQILSLSSSSKMQGLGMGMGYEQMQLLEERLHIQLEVEEGSVSGGIHSWELVKSCHQLIISWKMYRL